MSINFDKIPMSLRELPQWVLWKLIVRGGKPTKVPFQINGSPAKANDPTTWTTFDAACAAYTVGGYAGIGFEFSKDDPFCGVDLDGCRDAKTGTISDWARDVILLLGTYAEVSPSETGVKLFIRAKLPFANGKKKEVPDIFPVCEKTPAIEVYDWGRYFALTGWRISGQSPEVESRQDQLAVMIAQYFPNDPIMPPPRSSAPAPDFRSDSAVFARARKYLSRLPPAVSGQGGHGRTFHAACVLVHGFELSQSDAMTLMQEYSQVCQPPWSDKELLHKVRSASEQAGQRGYLRNAAPDRWGTITVPTYAQTVESATKPEPRQTTLLDATRAYVDKLRTGESSLISLGIPDLDYAIGGGVEKGEMIIIAARPSHGKSAVGLQSIHYWTANGMPCAIVSEEMAALALGKRTVQFVSDIPQEHWFDLLPALDRQIDHYAETHAKCIVLEGCGTAQAAREAIERAVQQDGAQCVVVDYAQLLGAPGRDRYQQMTNMSVTLRQVASAQKIVLMALCQMSRAIESRNEFIPVPSDLKECVSGKSIIIDADTGLPMTIETLVKDKLRPRLWSMDHNWKLVKSRVSDAWEAGKKTVYDVRFRSGRVLRCTDKQRFFTEDGWMELHDIPLRMTVAVPRSYETGIVSHGMDDKMVLLGWMVGDGNFCQTPTLTVANDDVDLACRLALSCFGIIAKVVPERLSESVKRIVMTTGRYCGAGKNPLTTWLRSIGVWGQTGINKTTPLIVYGLSDGEAAAYLRGLFHADGCLSGKGRIRLVTISESLARSVQHLLLRVGIISTVGKGRQDARPYGGSTKWMWSVDITSKARVSMFLARIGFLGSKHLRAIEDFDASLPKSASQHIDKLPHRASMAARQAKDGAGVGHAEFGWREQGKKMSRATAAVLAEKWKSNELQRYSKSDLLWDELVSVDHVGQEMTYDLTVDETANYVVNDTITHNTGQLEQDADVIIFLCWPHRINEREPPNKFQFFISKNRNRPTNMSAITCRFIPARQQVLDASLEYDHAPIPD